MTAETAMTIGSYLIERLHDLGVRHVFGVPGDFSLGFCELLEQDGRIRFVGTTREDTAGFAADGYARRQSGFGVVLVTHGVGALSTVNPIAGANAESSPVLVISGAPGMDEQRGHTLIHHSFGADDAQRRIFETFTCASARIQSSVQAPYQINDVLQQVWSRKKPGYLELPRDMVSKPIEPGFKRDAFFPLEPNDDDTLNEALEETAELLARAANPVVLAGVELHRFGLQKELVELVEAANLPVAATIMGKTVIDESHPLYLGIYQGLVGSEACRRRIESADVLVTLGVMFTDINLGMHTARLDLNHMIRANQGEVRVKHHLYSPVALHAFLHGLIDRMKQRGLRFAGNPDARSRPLVAEPPGGNHGDTLSTSDIIQSLNRKMTPDLAVVCDTGDCLFAADELMVPDRTAFFASAFYTTMGFAVPAALGVACASPGVRPLILVGDGAFQMTGTELSTHKKMGFAPIVVILNNGGYETERVILDGTFNDIEGWDYRAVCNLIQYGKGCTVRSCKDFEKALDQALAERETMHVIDAVVSESSKSMQRLAGEIGKQLQNAQ